ncbi:hypothetical protein [Brevibacillus centrosporus]|uniref:LysM domain-containing protein n=1 Tax=Brevibacillus centrosporus TaxID=54910 RepID=A0A1I3Y080_9BACL|nr:hypothetical protein [Brevibacillus centrosporus]SFK25163.1 hypothetical protein SAMN05518846_110164 [Brevibacillus centrosporus]
MFSKAKMGMLLGAMAAVLSIGSLGSAMAADTTQTQTQAKDLNKPAEVNFKGNMGHRGGIGFGFGYEKNEELLALLKLDATKLSEELKAGKTLAAIAEAQGVDEDDVIALLVKQEEAKLAEAVKAGKLTQEQADKMTENSAERVKAMVENTHQDRGHGKMMFGFGLGKNEELLTLLKLDETKFKEELTAGKSLAEIAEAQGVDKQDVIDLLVSKQKEQLAEAVKAGKLTQEEADKRSEEFATIAQKVVEGTFEKVAFPRKEKEQDNAEKTTVTE